MEKISKSCRSEIYDQKTVTSRHEKSTGHFIPTNFCSHYRNSYLFTWMATKFIHFTEIVKKYYANSKYLCKSTHLKGHMNTYVHCSTAYTRQHAETLSAQQQMSGLRCEMQTKYYSYRCVYTQYVCRCMCVCIYIYRLIYIHTYFKIILHLYIFSWQFKSISFLTHQKYDTANLRIHVKNNDFKYNAKRGKTEEKERNINLVNNIQI